VGSRAMHCGGSGGQGLRYRGNGYEGRLGRGGGGHDQKGDRNRGRLCETDLRQRSDIEAMVARVIREFGRIDVLANVAAICPRERIKEVKEETYEQVFRRRVISTCPE
jgi:NAD(P)-dependent dehydrogenase (short-subunit alcohol dehydrogenase family)